MNNAGTILLWGPPTDAALAAVRNELVRMGCPTAFVDQESTLDTKVDLKVGRCIEGVLRTPDEIIDLDDVRSAYIRPADPRELPAVADAGPASELWQHAVALHDILISWADLTSSLVINRPSIMAANGSKPYQSAWIDSLGFRTPETLITTDASAAVEFWQRHGRVIYKSCSGIRSIVSELTLEHTSRLDNIASCPTQFQEYVPGTDYRVHVVGQTVFASRILSDATDYRYSAGRVEMKACDLPDDVLARCKTLAASMKLWLAGIDLRCTPEGTWYCFEVNTSPGFTYFQDATGQPIAAAVAQILGSGTEACLSSNLAQNTCFVSGEMLPV